jgi:hypothetical protein
MGIHIKEVLPMLETISKQQGHILERLARLIKAIGQEPEPVEPVLRSMLKPMSEDIGEMKRTLSPNTSLPGS